MNQEIKKAWVEALRSGEYAQGSNLLRLTKPEHVGRETGRNPNNVSASKFCVLGVLCQVLEKRFPSLTYAHSSNPDFWAFGGEQKSGISLRKEVLEAADLRAEDLWAEFEGARIPLARLNDLGYNFKFLADLIEAQL